jgi:hypothetical protein
LLQGFFYGFSGFPPFPKINISKFQFDHGRSRATSLSAHTAVTCYPCKTKTFIYLFIYIYFIFLIIFSCLELTFD